MNAAKLVFDASFGGHRLRWSRRRRPWAVTLRLTSCSPAAACSAENFGGCYVRRVQEFC